jgi:Reverse transcriptase (RNA-dependent DNA polymerase)
VSFCSKLEAFFLNKVHNIKSAISLALTSQQFSPVSSEKPFSGDSMSNFAEVTADEVEKLLKSMPSTSSPLDFIPTSLIKSCSGTFGEVIARLVNLSFEHSMFPIKFKTAQVTPLLKKHGFDVSDHANYRPISNLNTISKILEWLVLIRLVPHASTSSSFDAVQSAYRRLHSTKTALLKITDDIFAGFDDNHQSTILVALDQLAVFDCVDYKTFVSRLDHTFGVTRSALD